MSDQEERGLEVPSGVTESRERERRQFLFFAILTTIGIAYGLWSSVRIRWVCDDAFITLRYIQNLLNGNGLVYNVGERVEGYTHFLWLCLVALFQWIGFEPVAVTQVLGILAYVATLALFAVISYRFSAKRALPIPLTTLVLALHFDFKVWVTGGLETSLFTFLVTAAFYVTCVSDLRVNLRHIFAGLLLTLAVLTRPDGLVFYVLVLLFLVARSASDDESRGVHLRRLLLFNAPAFALLVPHLLWKLLYYGSVLPNTYYAKSGGDAYYSQGFFYLWVYFKAYLSSVLMLLGLGALLRADRSSLPGRQRGRLQGLIRGKQEAAVVLAIVLVLGYCLLFVARVGGDFMYARFLHPVIPFVYFLGEMGLRRLLERRGLVYVLVAGAILLLVVHEKSRRDDIFFAEDGTSKSIFGPRGVADEYWFWTHKYGGLSSIERHKRIGSSLAVYFEGEKVKVLLGGQASLGYYGRFTHCIEHAGLTDAHIARLPVEKRGRPGHEKSAPLEYIESIGTNFLFMKPPLKPDPYRLAFFRVEGGHVQGEIITYNRELMRNLRSKFPHEIDFVDFEFLLDGWIQSMPTLPVAQVASEYEAFRAFYFQHNDDPEREQRIISHIQGRLASPRVP